MSSADGLPAGVNARDAVDLVTYMERMKSMRETQWQMDQMRRRWGALALYDPPGRAHDRIVKNYVEGLIDVETLIEQIGTLTLHELPPVTDD